MFYSFQQYLIYLFPHGLSNRVYCLAWILSNLIVEKHHLGVVLFCIYFIVSKTEYIFLCLRTTWLSFSVYCFFISLATLVAAFLCSIFRTSLYVRDSARNNNILSVISANYFSKCQLSFSPICCVGMCLCAHILLCIIKYSLFYCLINSGLSLRKVLLDPRL